MCIICVVGKPVVIFSNTLVVIKQYFVVYRIESLNANVNEQYILPCLCGCAFITVSLFVQQHLLSERASALSQILLQPSTKVFLVITKIR